MSERETCAFPGCANATSARSAWCRRHWRKLPSDLRERYRWAVDEEDEMEMLATMHAITEFLEG